MSLWLHQRASLGAVPLSIVNGLVRAAAACSRRWVSLGRAGPPQHQLTARLSEYWLAMG